MEETYSYHAKFALDTGKQRKTNQDVVIVLDDVQFYAVSDGMGGLINGGETSALVKDLLPTALKAAKEALEGQTDIQIAADALKAQIILLAEEVYRQGIEYGRDRFGAALCGVWLIGNNAVFVNIGDSRGYIWHNDALRQITKDHNIAAHLVERGELTPNEARSHPSRSRLLRYVGMKPPIHPDIFTENLPSDCGILLCSDGLYGMLTDGEIAGILANGEDNVTKRLINAANEAGGDDNISVILIKAQGGV